VIEKDISPDVARRVSKSLIIHYRRAVLELNAKSDRIQNAMEYAERFAKRWQMLWTKRGAHLLLQT
jgi:hypothetical protein